MATRAARSIVALLVLLALGSFVLYRTFGRPRPERPEAPPAGLVVQSADEASRVEDGPAPIPEAPPESAKTLDASDASRKEAGTSAELELADALWVSGIVKLPANTPVGERVGVIANGKPFARRDPHYASVAGDGSFRVAFAPGTRTGRLLLVADHLYLESTPSFRVEKEPEGHVLEPKLGGRILGVVVPPADAPDAADVIAAARVEARVMSFTSATRLVSARIRPDRTFELLGVDANQALRISFESDLWVSSAIVPVQVAPGEDRRVELELRVGARLRGTVLDERGEAVRGAGLTLVVRSRGGSFESDESIGKDGSFDLRGLEPGATTLTAKRPGYEAATLDLGETREGETRSGIALVLRQGHSIAGRVTWPDGRPAAKVQVQGIAGTGGDGDVPSPAPVVTAEDGTFRISGLPGRSQSIAAFTVASREAGDTKKPETEGAAPAETRKSSGKIRWSAIARDVVCGTEGLELVLGKGSTLRGRVVNDLGAPVAKFSVLAVLAGSDSEDDSRPIRLSGRFTSTDGTFALEGVSDGQWFVHATATGHVESERTSVLVPGTGTTGDLSITRAAVVHGIVRGPDGNPVGDMRVECKHKDVSADGINRTTSTQEHTDARGRFAFKAVVPGECTLQAGQWNGGSSAPMKLTLAPGQELEGIVLDIRRGARLTVEVVPDPGSEAAGCELSLSSHTGEARWRDAVTDASGIAVIEGLEPGEWEVSVKPDPRAVRELQRTSGQDEWKARMSLERSKKIELADGDDVRLRIEPKSAGRSIVVSGTVRRSGKALPDARIEAQQWRESSGWATFFARSDSNGLYSMTVDEPGGYTFSIRTGRATGGLERWYSVPDRPACTIDLDSPGGMITGRVVGPEGVELKSITLILAFDKRYVPTESGDLNAITTLEAPGEFRFEDLPMGVYRIDAWGTAEPPKGRSRADFCASEAGLWLAAETTVDGLVLNLQSMGSLTGVVRDADGTPAVRALVSCIDEHGQLNPSRYGLTDEGGRYRIDGLAPGAWGLVARLERSVTREPVPVQIVAGENAQADVDMGAGSALSITLRSPDGEPVYAALTIWDSRSRERFRCQVREESGAEQACGFLPSGTYTIAAVDYFDRRVAREFTVDAASDTKLELAFEKQ